MIQAYAQSCDKSNFTFTIITIKNTTRGGSNKFKDTTFENTKAFWIPKGSKLFHSMIVKGTKEFLNKLYSFGGLGTFVVFFIFCKTFLVFCTYVINEVIINLILGKFFLGVPHIAPLITKQTLYWRNSSFLMKGHFTCLIIIKKHHHDRDGVWLKFYIIWLVGILAAMCFWDDNTYVFNLDDDREPLALSNTNAEWDIYFAMWLKIKWLLQLVL